MDDAIHVISEPDTAIAALKPLRAQLLSALSEPRSAAELAPQLGVSRQKIRYHLDDLESRGLVKEASHRRWGGIKERRMVANALGYLVSPEAMGPVAANPATTEDRLSAGYLLALAGRVVREVGGLAREADDAGKRLATLSLDTTVRFRSPRERAAFARELVDSILNLVARYHDPQAVDGRDHRVVLAAHPFPADEETP